MSFGFHNKVLRVDLSTAQIDVEEPGERFFRTYYGGWGLIAHYLLHDLPPRVDPLGPENLLIFATGVVTGAPVAGSGRSAVGAKSPLTGGFGEADVGGWWGTELTKAGFDAIIFKGRAENPVYVWINDGQVEIRPAGHLWGMLTAETEAALHEELGDKRVRVAQVGPAGERLSPIAAVMHDINRAAGRTGLGAVMGSKNLKAVAVRGTGKKEIADPEALRDIAQWYVDHYSTTWAAGLQQDGTANGVYQHLTGGLPTDNFQRGTFDEGWEAITGTKMTETILKDRDTCFSCPVRCKRVVEVKEGAFTADPTYGGPEYETMGSLGSTCGVGDLAAIARGNELCNAYGLDTISCGVSIAWAMECFERGLITTEDTGGIELRFGDAAAMVHLVELIGKREGFGKLAGEGAYKAAQTIGRGSEDFAMHVKGQEIPMHEPRIKYGLGVGYAVSPTGADHMHNFHDANYGSEENIAGLASWGTLEPMEFNDLGPAKMRLASRLIPWSTLCNSLGYCMFVASSSKREKIVEMVRAITGWDATVFELLKAGERAYTMSRAFNAREGFRAEDDRLPTRFFEAFTAGPSEGNALSPQEFDRARVMFYQMMGWDEETAVPKEWKLHELGVGWVAEELRRHNS